MGCFEDFMQFRDDVDEVKRNNLAGRATSGRRCREDLAKKEEDISKFKVKA
ncbi:MAG: hypothetical protein LUO89_12625 [Methanothrix sp.]|nr:hypothetical protein [Methanothrix sp.]